MKIVWQ